MLKERLANRIWFARVGLVTNIEPSFIAGEYWVTFAHPVTQGHINTLKAVGLKADELDRHTLAVMLPNKWLAPDATVHAEQPIMEAAMELIASVPTSLPPELYRRDGYGKKQRDGECKVFYDLGQVRMAVEHITQDDEDGVYFAHLKGLDTPLMLNDDDRLIVEWRTLQYEACDYVPEPRVVNDVLLAVTAICQHCQQQYDGMFSRKSYEAIGERAAKWVRNVACCPICDRIQRAIDLDRESREHSFLLDYDPDEANVTDPETYWDRGGDFVEVIEDRPKTIRDYQPTLHAEVSQHYKRVFEAGAALSPFDQIRIMANEIETLREKLNAAILEDASKEQSIKGISAIAADNMRERDAALTELEWRKQQLRALGHEPDGGECDETATYRDLFMCEANALNAKLNNAWKETQAELEQARRWAAVWKKRAKLYWKTSLKIRRKLPAKINGENNHA